MIISDGMFQKLRVWTSPQTSWGPLFVSGKLWLRLMWMWRLLTTTHSVCSALPSLRGAQTRSRELPMLNLAKSARFVISDVLSFIRWFINLIYNAVICCVLIRFAARCVKLWSIRLALAISRSLLLSSSRNPLVRRLKRPPPAFIHYKMFTLGRSKSWRHPNLIWGNWWR